MAKALMHIGPASIAHPQSAGLEQPCEGALNDSTCEPKLVAVFGTPPSQLRKDASRRDATMPPVISAVRLHALRFSAWPSASTGDFGDTAVHQGHELSRIIRRSGLRSAAYRCRRRQDGACCPPCADQSGWRQFPPCTARTEELSAITRKKSSRSAWRNLASRIRCSLSTTYSVLLFCRRPRSFCRESVLTTDKLPARSPSGQT